jgi:hypothetical protein
LGQEEKFKESGPRKISQCSTSIHEYSRVFAIIDLIDYRVSQITVTRVVLSFESRDAVELWCTPVSRQRALDLLTLHIIPSSYNRVERISFSFYLYL